jgi:hypothetical protein
VFLFENKGKKGCDKVYYLLCKKIFITPTPLDLFPGAFRSHRKKRILVQNQGGREYQTGGIHRYFEDLI